MPVIDGISIDAAMKSLRTMPDDDAPVVEEKKKKAPAAQSDAGNADSVDDDVDEGDEDQTASDDASGDDAGDDGDPSEDNAEVEDEAGDEAEPSTTTIEPPTFLDAKEREAFAKLPQAAQEIVSKHGKLLQSDYSRKAADIAHQRRELSDFISQRKEKWTALFTEKERTLSKWQKVNWAEQSKKLSPEAYNRNRALMEQDFTEYRDMQRQQQGEEAKNLADHDRIQARVLKEIAPHLIDGEAGKARRREIQQHLLDQGYDPKEVRRISAMEAVYVDKALKWDAYMAEKSTKAALKPKQGVKPAGKPVRAAARPASSSNPATPSTKAFKKKPTMANAMAAIADID